MMFFNVDGSVKHVAGNMALVVGWVRDNIPPWSPAVYRKNRGGVEYLAGWVRGRNVIFVISNDPCADLHQQTGMFYMEG